MKINLIILFFNFCTFCCYSQNKIAKNKFIEDLDLLKTKLEKQHLGMYHYLGKEHFENELITIKNNLPDSVTSQMAFQITAKLITELKDLHTSVVPSKKTISKKRVSFPFILRKIDDKIYIHYNLSADTSIIRTSEVLAVNNEPINDILIKLQNLYGTDNNNQISKEYYSVKSFAHFYHNLYGVNDSIQITYKTSPDSAAKTKTVPNEKAPLMTKRLKERYKNSLRINFGYTLLDTINHIAKLDITSFTYKKNKLDAAEIKFKRDLKKRFALIEKQGIKHLIIDFRANGGGYVGNVGRITKYVANEPFKLLDSTIIKPSSFLKAFKIWTIIPPLIARLYYKKNVDGNLVQKIKSYKTLNPLKKHHYDNQLYVLMDGGSYSATAFTIGLWKDQQRATFIGTRPGGANWGSFAGIWSTYIMPHSQVRVRIPLLKIVHAQKNKTTNTFFVEPDFEVNNNLEDFKKREDTQLKFTLDLIKSKK
jgi:C-terminal processing protease CtpA/Prc